MTGHSENPKEPLLNHVEKLNVTPDSRLESFRSLFIMFCAFTRLPYQWNKSVPANKTKKWLKIVFVIYIWHMTYGICHMTYVYTYDIYMAYVYDICHVTYDIHTYDIHAYDIHTYMTYDIHGHVYDIYMAYTYDIWHMRWCRRSNGDGSSPLSSLCLRMYMPKWKHDSLIYVNEKQEVLCSKNNLFVTKRFRKNFRLKYASIVLKWSELCSFLYTNVST